MASTVIFMPLLKEGVDAWRPVDAIELDGGPKVFSDGKTGLVALERLG